MTIYSLNKTTAIQYIVLLWFTNVNIIIKFFFFLLCFYNYYNKTLSILMDGFYIILNAPTGLIKSSIQLFSPKTDSISSLNFFAILSGTKFSVVPANPPP